MAAFGANIISVNFNSKYDEKIVVFFICNSNNCAG